MFSRLSKGIFTVSIDLELGWGWRGIGISPQMKQLILEEGQIVHKLLALFHRYNTKVTWAVVGHLLLDPPKPNSSTHDSAGLDLSDFKLWYCWELVKSIRQAEPTHDLASHSFSHIPYDEHTTRQLVQNDLEKANLIHRKRDIPFQAFVFPWNHIGHRDLLAAHKICIYRGTDNVWYRRLPQRLSRIVLFLDKVIPIAPNTVLPKTDAYDLVSVPGCMALAGRYGAFTEKIAISKMKAGIDRAMRLKEVFHLWFHPAAFYYKRTRQFQILEEMLRYSSKHMQKGDLLNLTLSEYLEDAQK
jgi:hypothetical protein